MTTPLWVLVIFAGWTLLTLVGSVGVYRLQLILSGEAEPVQFQADVPHGNESYRRAMRAHMNCVENLPLYGALCLAIYAAGIHSRALDALAVTYIVARICQTLTHVGFPLSNRSVRVRSAFFTVQLACLVTIGVLITVYA